MTEFLVMFSVFVKLKVTVNENVSFIIYASGIRLPDCSKLAINRKMTMTSQISKYASIFFDLAVFLLSSLVSGPGFKSI